MSEEPANILVVDDLPEKLLVFSSILEELGQNLVMVRSGSEALREVLHREFAVILLDVNMPDIDGLETAKLIRQYKKSAHTPIIFITAYADEMQTAQGYSRGAAEEARRRANFLAHASQELGASLDLEQGMRRLLDLVVPHVGDVAALTVEKEPGKFQTISAPSSEFVPPPLAAAMKAVLAQPVVQEAGEEAGLAATLCLPLRVGERTIGALAL